MSLAAENDKTFDELDSLLESLEKDEIGSPDKEGENSLKSDSGEQIKHMVNAIDPDAVDFTPFLQNHSGSAVNYHDESHMITKHHAKLHLQTQTAGILKDLPTPSSSQKKKKTTKRNKRGLLYPLQWLFYTFIDKLYSFVRRFRRMFTSKEEENDRMKYIAAAMLAFILYVMMRGENGPVSDLKLEKTINSIIPLDFNDAYKDINDRPLEVMDTPIYWHIPRSGGTTMKLVMSMCMGRVVACEQGAGHQLDEQLEIINKAFGNFANVDTSTPLGLNRAAELGLVPSRIVDVVLTPHIREAAKLFDENHKGRLFTMLRNPVDRVVSLYHFLRMPGQEASIGFNINAMSLEEFAADVSENWMVRTLTNTVTGSLDENHLKIAKEILRRKFLIGLLDEKTESLRRIQAYFGWKLPSRVSQTCKNNMFYFEPQSKNIHDVLERDSEVYETLRRHNQFDMDLYEYAVELFNEQKAMFSDKKQ
mmetsp:Transcript_7684/g.11744  ORF Transcript_7684/g.11744 Transcript_7684/m.11744 type:complete len:477 (-) Transcript_7684:167-1597(-)|eukprot:CAMPEP_0178908132 /NCGR_PEP_ID=MMETSP0786-20121207/7753_1 /TAXON_ID=186022 /ORGANISM="Thalassionema frauenfeldii, Strain CCMP 1798" /LENGTH=476 /DNA_ID=CAMNT_0020580001 /DNA_START=101 /DNA_END=1531 /DNA_ORIENTATION=-